MSWTISRSAVLSSDKLPGPQSAVYFSQLESNIGMVNQGNGFVDTNLRGFQGLFKSSTAPAKTVWSRICDGLAENFGNTLPSYIPFPRDLGKWVLSAFRKINSVFPIILSLIWS